MQAVAFPDSEPGSELARVADRLYQEAYDHTTAEMWKRVDSTAEMVARLVRARLWIRDHSHLLNAGSDQYPALHGRWDAYREALDVFMDGAAALSLAGLVLVEEARMEGVDFAADITEAHAAIAADDTIDPAERLRILSGMHTPPLFNPPPARPECPPFCRTIHADGDTEVHSGEESTVDGREQLRGEGPRQAKVVTRQYEFVDGPTIDLYAADVELSEDAAFRLGIELIRRVGDLRRQRQGSGPVPALFTAGHDPGE
jgi:hypothetical protein